MKNFWNKYGKIIILFVALKLVLVATIFFLKSELPFNKHEFLTKHFYGDNRGTMRSQPLAFWDGQWYKEIASVGYDNHYPFNANYAFFPLYPAFLRITSFLFAGNMYIAGILLNLALSLFVAIFMYKFFLLDVGKNEARRGVVFFLCYPASIFYLASYNMALFLGLSLISVYAARKRRWWIAGIAGCLATLTRPQGILLFIPVAVEYLVFLREEVGGIKMIVKKFFSQYSSLALFLIPLGLFGFFTYSFFTTGNFFAPLEAQRYFNRSGMSLFNIVTVVWEGMVRFSDLPWFDFKFSRIDYLIAMLWLALIMPIFQRIRLSYALYALAAILLPLSSGTPMSIARFASLSFPHFLLLGLMIGKKKYVTMFLCILSIGLSIVFTIRFVNFYWVG